MTEPQLRLAIFLAVLVIMILWETRKPNRISPVTKNKRWTSNFLLVVCGSLAAKLVLPAGLTAVAYFASEQSLGLLPLLSLPTWLTVVIAIILLDCLIYWQHRLFHKIPLFWRLHKVHHADPHLDASTGLRFHPIEIVLSLLIKASAIIILGVPAQAVLLFEIILNTSSIFTHSNIKLPNKIEWPLRKLIVTQAMHRIHHSEIPSETDSNFGFNLSIWDRCFNTYTANAKAGDAGLTIGLKAYKTAQSNTGFFTLLFMPFKQKS